MESKNKNIKQQTRLQFHASNKDYVENLCLYCPKLEGLLDFPLGHKIQLDNTKTRLKNGSYEIVERKEDCLFVNGAERFGLDPFFLRIYNLVYTEK